MGPEPRVCPNCDAYRDEGYGLWIHDGVDAGQLVMTCCHCGHRIWQPLEDQIIQRHASAQGDGAGE